MAASLFEEQLVDALDPQTLSSLIVGVVSVSSFGISSFPVVSFSPNDTTDDPRLTLQLVFCANRAMS